MKAIVLLSGGLDSTTCLAIALKSGYECYPLAIDYAQTNNYELEAAKLVSRHYSSKAANISSLKVVKLSGMDLNVGLDFYVPARNSILLSIAASLAESMGISNIFLGLIGKSDGSTEISYPDGEGSFVDMMEAALTAGTRSGVTIITPVLELTKTQVLLKAVELDVPTELTRSCLEAGKRACRECKSCKIRAAAFNELSIADPSIF